MTPLVIIYLYSERKLIQKFMLQLDVEVLCNLIVQVCQIFAEIVADFFLNVLLT